MARIPDLADTGIRKFFCGPESFTSDVHPLLGPAPELDNYFVAAGLNSLGILFGGGVGTVMASWIVDGEPPVDVTGYAIDRTSPHESTRAFRRERTDRAARGPLRRRRLPLVATHHGPEHAALGAPRPVRRGRGATSTRRSGGSSSSGSRAMRSRSSRIPGFRRPASFDLVAGEHRTVRERVGIMDMTLMAKFVVQGRDAAAVLSRLSANHVDREVGPGGLHPVAPPGGRDRRRPDGHPGRSTSGSWWSPRT